MTKWSASWLLLIGLAILLCWTSPSASSSTTSGAGGGAASRELKALRLALKKQHRAKELQRSKAAMAAAAASKGGGGGEYVPEAGPWSSTSADEPSCEQLREMWRQSKRHSRAAETTNEIPQYSDPFARSYGRQLASVVPTLRPRPERRPVVYGRLHSSPPSDQEAAERPVRPFDVLRKLNSDPGSSGSVILYGEDDKAPFGRASARGSLQHLRELIREEQQAAGQLGAGVKGSFQQLRDVVREEQQQQQQPSHQQQSGRPHQAHRSSGDWSEADVGRVVTSPADHGANSGKYSLYSMQGDAPYEPPAAPSHHQHSSSRRHSSSSNQRNGSSFSKASGIRKQQQQPGEEAYQRSSGSNSNSKVFQKVGALRPRVGQQQHRGRPATAASTSSYYNDQLPATSERDYATVVSSNSNPYHYSSKSSRRASSTSETPECGDADEQESGCRSRAGIRRRCLAGRCAHTNNQQRSTKASTVGMTDDDVVQDLLDALQLDEESSAE